MAKQTKKKNYTDEFKCDAVRLMRNRGKRTVAQITDDLGVSDGMLHRWAEKLDKASTGRFRGVERQRCQGQRHYLSWYPTEL